MDRILFRSHVLFQLLVLYRSPRDGAVRVAPLKAFAGMDLSTFIQAVPMHPYRELHDSLSR